MSGCEATLSSFSELCAQLDSSRDQRKVAQDQLQDKKNRIDKFSEIVVSTNHHASFLLLFCCVETFFATHMKQY